MHLDLDELIVGGYHLAHTQEKRQSILDKMKTRRIEPLPVIEEGFRGFD